MCRCDTSARVARSSWLRPRFCLHDLSSVPNGDMAASYANKVLGTITRQVVVAMTSLGDGDVHKHTIDERYAMLTNSLRANALFSAACGITLVAAHESLADVFGVPPWTVLVVGAGLIPFAAAVWWVSTSPKPTYVRLIIAADTVWVVSAMVLTAGFPGTMTTIGLWALAVVTLVVADLAVAQGIGLHRSRPATSDPQSG